MKILLQKNTRRFGASGVLLGFIWGGRNGFLPEINVGGRLVFVEVYAFERNNGETFLRLFEVFADSQVAIFDELLLHEAVFLAALASEVSLMMARTLSASS